jgi:hypothetical protein
MSIWGYIKQILMNREPKIIAKEALSGGASLRLTKNELFWTVERKTDKNPDWSCHYLGRSYRAARNCYERLAEAGRLPGRNGRN